MAYDKSGESLIAEVLDIPLGKGLDQKTDKRLFQPPFLAEALNIEVEKTGAVKKRDGIQHLVPIPLSLTGGTVFEHPAGQLGIVGAPNYSFFPDAASMGVVKNSGDFATSAFVGSNQTGIYACGIEEDPVTRSDEAVLHVQTGVSGNKLLTVWCVQQDPVIEARKADTSWVTQNAAYYMIRERDSGTVTVPPTKLVTFTNQPRYTHISLVDSVDPHWVVVSATDVHSETAWQELKAVAISASTEAITATATLSFVDGQTAVSKFSAFDMHAGENSDYAHIIAQEGDAYAHSPYLFRIDKTLTVSQFRVLANDEVPLNSGAVLHVPGQGVFTAVSNQHGIAGALAGDWECHLHRYSEVGYTPQAGYPQKIFTQVVPGAAPEIGKTGACTRLSIGLTSSTGNGVLHVYGSQFWNPAGVKMLDLTAKATQSFANLEQAITTSEFHFGSKSFVKTQWIRVDDAFTGTPIPRLKQEQASTFLVTKAFKKGLSDYPMIGIGVTNGQPSASQRLEKLSATDKDTGKIGDQHLPYRPRESQPSKHPMGLIVAPERIGIDGEFGDVEQLRGVARFGMDLLVECEDVFPLTWGNDINFESETNQNPPSRWLAPGLSSVWGTEVAGEMLFVYKSRIRSGVERKVGYNRLSKYGVGGTFFTTTPNNAYGGEEVRINLLDLSLRTVSDTTQTYFSGGYLAVFDGVYNGESDAHTSPGRPLVEYRRTSGSGLTSDTPEEALGISTFFSNNAPLASPDLGEIFATAKYSLVLVYAILDEDGRFHRSAPSPIFAPAQTTPDFSCLVLRYLMPPPSAFESLGDKTLYLEVYLTAEFGGEFSPSDASYSGKIIDTATINNFTLIDRFIPEIQNDLTPYANSSAATPRLTGSHLTPFDRTAVTRSGFTFYGERVLFQPRGLRKNFAGSLPAQTVYSPDDGQMADTLLYTTGGIIENDPPPPYVDIAVVNSRMWGIPSNNRSSVWFSKKLQPGVPPQWSAAFTVALPRGSNAMKGVAGLDEKVLLFSEDDIFVIIGDGPNNSGRGGSFTGPTRVASDVGCVKRRSIVEGPFGVMFQSAKGIYSIGRDLTVSYIGAQVED